jgi:hypothetical protein
LGVAEIPQPVLLSSKTSLTSLSPELIKGIYSVFILRQSGCPFFYRVYDDKCSETDPAILGGFFTALSLFAKEVTAGQIETITTSPCRYTFHHLQEGLLVLCSSKDFNSVLLERIVKRITSLFLRKYDKLLCKPYPASVTAPKLGARIDSIFEEVLGKYSRKTKV